MNKFLLGLAGSAAVIMMAAPASAQVTTGVTLTKSYFEDVDVFYTNDVNVDIDKEGYGEKGP